MQSHRWQHGSSGELDVFGATRYFAGRAHSATVAQLAAERLTQAKVVMHDTGMAESFRGQDDDLRHAQELELAKLAGKNKLAAFFGFMVSPSPGASFHRRPPPRTTSGSAAAGDQPRKVSSSTTSSRKSTDDSSVQLEGHGYGVDLGVAKTGDRRLQGVKVVRGSGGDEERWVVRCTSCWHQEEQHAEMFYAGSSDDHGDQVKDEGEDGANPGNWESDSSSDLFDLDIEYVHL